MDRFRWSSIFHFDYIWASLGVVYNIIIGVPVIICPDINNVDTGVVYVDL